MSDTRSSEQAQAGASTPESAVDDGAVGLEAGPAVEETTASHQKWSASGGKRSSRGWFRTLAPLRRPRVVVSALVVVALLATIGVLCLHLHRETTARQNRDEALAAGQAAALALTSYDFHDLHGNFAAVARSSSPRFAQQYKQVSASLTTLIQQYRATSKGTVLDRGVAEVDGTGADGSRAVLTLFVDQAITNTNNPQPRVDRNRMRMTLVRSGDRWLVDDVQLV